MSGVQRIGVLLANLGTPAAPTPRAVRRYLGEFLSDPRVVDLPAPARWLLLRALILPFRPRRAAKQYASIWMDAGSPLLVHGRAFEAALARALGPGFVVVLGMRYGEPALAAALDTLIAADVSRIVVLPLYPQYASSSSGSTLERVYGLAAMRDNVPALDVISAFHDNPGFIEAFATVVRPVLEASRPDHVLLSFHGLPERHVRKADPTGKFCLVSPGCCDAVGPANRFCYRAACFATSRALAEALGLAPGAWSVSFQSRLGRDRWLTPYTDQRLPALAQAGIRRLAVLCPAFVADCLETVEEIGIRARDQWRELGGEELVLAPSLNASAGWVEAASAWIKRRAAGG